jgi:hypothetical protein
MGGKYGSEGFYEVLDVDPDAGTEAVERAYRERVKETHPDVSDAPEERARAQFRAVNRAHDVLSDPAERERYDRLGHEAYLAARHGVPAGGGRASRGSRGSTTGWTRSGSTSRSRSGARQGTATGATARASPTGHAAGTTRTGPGSRGNESPSAPSAPSTPGGPVGTVVWGTARWLRFVAALLGVWQSRLTSEGAATAAAAFAVYPVLVVSSVTPWFPLSVNLAMAVLTLPFAGYLVTRPAVGMPVFAGWTLLFPVALTVAGIGVVSLAGTVAMALAVGPLALTLVALADAVRT